MNTIGLIAATSQKRDALLRYIKGWKPMLLGSWHCQGFDLSGQTCLLVTSGMGVRRAGEAARNLVEITTPRMLVSFGIAGAVEADLMTGDVIAAEAVCRLEQGSLGPRLPLACWPDQAREEVTRVLSRRGARLFTGTAVTTSGSQLTQNQTGNIPHPVLEMETAGIAQVSAETGIPLFSLRAISDGPQAPIPFDLGEMMDEDANLKVGRMLKILMHHPRILFQAGRLIQNTRIAADHAAIALLAALSQWMV